MKNILLIPGHGGKIKKNCLLCRKEFFSYRSSNRKFCSIGCGTTHRNRVCNPSWNPETRRKISLNHADVSGENNPMFGRTGNLAPSYIDGRTRIAGDKWRKIALTHKEKVCELCGETIEGRRLHVHHKDFDRKNNELSNLQIVCVTCHNTRVHISQRDSLGRFAGRTA